MKVFYRERWFSTDDLWMVAIFNEDKSELIGVAFKNSSNTFIPASELSIPDTFTPGFINDKSIHTFEQLAAVIPQGKSCHAGGPPCPRRHADAAHDYYEGVRAWVRDMKAKHQA